MATAQEMANSLHKNIQKVYARMNKSQRERARKQLKKWTEQSKNMREKAKSPLDEIKITSSYSYEDITVSEFMEQFDPSDILHVLLRDFIENPLDISLDSIDSKLDEVSDERNKIYELSGNYLSNIDLELELTLPTGLSEGKQELGIVEKLDGTTEDTIESVAPLVGEVSELQESTLQDNKLQESTLQKREVSKDNYSASEFNGDSRDNHLDGVYHPDIYSQWLVGNIKSRQLALGQVQAFEHIKKLFQQK